MEEVTGGPLYRDRVGGIGTGTAGSAATIRVPSDRDPARRVAETRSFGAAKKEVLALAGWLRSWQVPAVVTEATGDYWKGPSCRLEAGGLGCVLAGAKQAGNLPGRPGRDPAGSRWLAACCRARRHHVVLRGRAGVPRDQAAHRYRRDRPGSGPGTSSGRRSCRDQPRSRCPASWPACPG